jgi:hypothetical protein
MILIIIAQVLLYLGYKKIDMKFEMGILPNELLNKRTNLLTLQR